MLSDLPTLKNVIGIPLTDTTQDDKLAQLVMASDTTIKNYLHRDLETKLYSDTSINRKGGTPDLPLDQRPLRPVLLTGNLSSGSNLLTQISTTNGVYAFAQLLSGQTAALTGANAANIRTGIPPFTTISNITANDPTNGNYVTLSNNATVTATGVQVLFGLDVYIDFGANYGFGNNAWMNGPGNSSRLYAGLDYAPQVDSPDGSCKSGLLILLGQSGYGGGLWALAPLAWGYGGISGYGPYGGPLTQCMPPTWPTYPGCIRVDYTAGLGVGATAPTGTLPPMTTIPQDLILATTQLAVWLWNNIDTGGNLVASESFQGFSRSLQDLAKSGLREASALGTTRDALSRYTEVPL